MKNIYEILKGFGLEVPEDKKSEFEKSLKENYITVSEHEKVKTSRDNFKAQLETATESLKKFEGVDVKDLQGKITTLNQQLETQKQTYEKQIADNDFNSLVDSILKDKGAKSTTATKALLDLKTLRDSKNQREDIESAVDKVKEEQDYMFNSEEPLDKGKFAGKSGGGSVEALDSMRAVMGLPPEKK